MFGVLSGMLPVLDDIDRAREHGELEGGFKAVADSLERVVSGLGLSRFGAAWRTIFLASFSVAALALFAVLVLTLGLGDGVAYESLEPADASIALTAIN